MGATLDSDRFPEKALEAARLYFEPQLRLMFLSQDQIASQSLDDLEASLTTVNDAINRAPSFGILPFKATTSAGWVVAQSPAESTLQVGILPILFERKSLILRRISVLRQEQGLSELKEAVADSIRDPSEQEALLAKVDEQLRVTIAESYKAEHGAAEADEAKERSVRLELEVAERKSAIRRSWLERESIASLLGAFLLLVLGVALIVAMFTNTAPPEIVTSAFLLILGYFFGQTTDRKSGSDSRSSDETP